MSLQMKNEYKVENGQMRLPQFNPLRELHKLLEQILPSMRCIQNKSTNFSGGRKKNHTHINDGGDTFIHKRCKISKEEDE